MLFAPTSVGSLSERTARGPDGSVAVASSARFARRPRRFSDTPATCVRPMPDLRIAPPRISGPIAALELLMSKKSPLTPATAPASRTWARERGAARDRTRGQQVGTDALALEVDFEHLRVGPADLGERHEVAERHAGADPLGLVLEGQPGGGRGGWGGQDRRGERGG